jgi:hypothetical protein
VIDVGTPVPLFATQVGAQRGITMCAEPPCVPRRQAFLVDTLKEVALPHGHPELEAQGVSNAQAEALERFAPASGAGRLHDT